MTLKNLSLSARLALSFAVIVLITVIIGSISLSSLFSLNNAADMNDHTYKVLATGDMMEIDALNVETGRAAICWRASSSICSRSPQAWPRSTRTSPKPSA